MKGYSPSNIETSSTKPSFSLELGMVTKCDECKDINCIAKKCECNCHK